MQLGFNPVPTGGPGAVLLGESHGNMSNSEQHMCLKKKKSTKNLFEVILFFKRCTKKVERTLSFRKKNTNSEVFTPP